jgi:hypothetical protein
MTVITPKTHAQWASENPVLGNGELVFEKDTGRMKVGDGVARYNDLIYAWNTHTVPGTAVQGDPGTPGQSAYQEWLSAGNVGTQAEFLASLVGPPGGSGATFKGAYQSSVNYVTNDVVDAPAPYFGTWRALMNFNSGTGGFDGWQTGKWKYIGGEGFGSAASFAAISATGGPNGYRFTVTNDPSYGKRTYQVQSGFWVEIGAMPNGPSSVYEEWLDSATYTSTATSLATATAAFASSTFPAPATSFYMDVDGACVYSTVAGDIYGVIIADGSGAEVGRSGAPIQLASKVQPLRVKTKLITGIAKDTVVGPFTVKFWRTAGTGTINVLPSNGSVSPSIIRAMV